MKALLIFWSCWSLVSASDLPWIGVVLTEATKEERIALKLETGVGLRVTSLSPDGPYDQAGGKNIDLWWKFDGQILLTRCQMVVLLRSKKAGDEVVVDLYRNGKLESLQLKLGSRPERKMYAGRHHHDAEKKKGRALLTRREEVARLKSKGRDISLQREGGNLKFEVRKGSQLVLSEVLREGKVQGDLPADLRESFQVLSMTLDGHASTPPNPGERRVRYVPRNQGSKE